MKKVLLSILFVGSATLANAQKSEIAEAKKSWSLFQIGGGKGAFDKTMASLNSGLKHTDLAIANEKSKVMTEAWSYRALFASAIAVTDSVDLNNALAHQKIAGEAIEKAKSLDTKNEEAENIKLAEINVRNAITGRAIRAYNKNDFNTALSLFNELLVINPLDTGMYLNAGVTAKQVEKYPESIQHFKKVISLNSPQSRDLYLEVINMTLEKVKDTVAGLALLKEASAKFPDDATLIGIETDLYINTGNIEKSQEMLSKLIAKDPSKALYHYLMGDTYFKQALAIQADRNKIDAKKVKEIDAATVKMTALIDKSLPFYKKSNELDPKFMPALESLKQVYGFKNDSANFDEVNKKLKALQAENP